MNHVIHSMRLVAESISRRTFLGEFAAASLVSAAHLDKGDPLDARVTQIRLSTLEGRFHKFVAMNAYDMAPKGTTYQHTLIRVQTDAGVEGIAPGSYANLATRDYAQELRPLIGCRLEELYTVSAGRVTGRQRALLRPAKSKQASGLRVLRHHRKVAQQTGVGINRRSGESENPGL